MSCLENEKAKEQAWLKLLDLYGRAYDDHGSSWGVDNKLLLLLSEAVNVDERYINDNDLEDLLEDLWQFDAECLCADVLTCVINYVEHNKKVFAEKWNRVK